MKLNAAAKSLIYQRSMLPTTGFRYHMIMVRGDTHTAAEISANFNQANSLFSSIATLITQIAARSGSVIAFAELLATVDPAMTNTPNALLHFDFSKIVPTVINSGSPDWFLIYPSLVSVNYNANGVRTFLMKGTITEFGGGGDLVVRDRAMVIGQARALTDLKVRQL